MTYAPNLRSVALVKQVTEVSPNSRKGVRLTLSIGEIAQYLWLSLTLPNLLLDIKYIGSVLL